MALLASQGNRKLGADHLILNITSATDCPSKKLGLCTILKRCYAMKAERLYRYVLAFRRSQEKQWDLSSAESLANLILERKGVRFMRFSESGDFRSQSDVDKMDKLAGLLKPHGITTYGYTARQDLDFSSVNNMTVNGSKFMIHNKYTAVPKTQSSNICAMNCRICDMCKYPSSLEIEVKYH